LTYHNLSCDLEPDRVYMYFRTVVPVLVLQLLYQPNQAPVANALVSLTMYRMEQPTRHQQ